MEQVEQSTSDLVKQVTEDAMSSWSDERRKEFVLVFRDRVQVSTQVLCETAKIIVALGIQRSIINHRFQSEAIDGSEHDVHQEMSTIGREWARDRYGHERRSYRDVYKIAEQRAKDILAELPPLKKALQVIDAPTAKLMDERDKIVAKGKVLLTKFNEMPVRIEMDSLDQKMTLADFRKFAEENEKARKKIARELNELGEEGAALQARIDKALVRGVPGLKEAVIAAAKAQVEKAKGLAQLNRRVEERVMFGDSDAALELLKKFELDEERLESDAKVELRASVEKLLGAASPKKGKKS